MSDMHFVSVNMPAVFFFYNSISCHNSARQTYIKSSVNSNLKLVLLMCQNVTECLNRCPPLVNVDNLVQEHGVGYRQTATNTTNHSWTPR